MFRRRSVPIFFKGDFCQFILLLFLPKENYEGILYPRFYFFDKELQTLLNSTIKHTKSKSIS